MHRLLRMLALPVAPLTLAVVACSSSGDSTPHAGTTPSLPSSAGTGCALAADSRAKPPSGTPTPSDATWYQRSRQGSTTQYFAFAPGTDVKQRRDAIKTQFVHAGYVVKGTDAEDNEEAEAEFEGHGHGEITLQVIPREGCSGQLRLRYRTGGG